MADENKDNKEQESKKDSKEDSKGSSFSLMTILIIVGAVVLSSVLGAGLSFLLTNKAPKTASAETEEKQVEPEKKNDKEADSEEVSGEESWYYDMAAVTANLDEPGVTRYVRVALTMELMFDPNIEGEEEKEFKAKLPILNNWLTIYLSSLSIEDIRGGKNLKRMQAQILDNYNEMLYPDQEPRIKQVLFKEFATQ